MLRTIKNRDKGSDGLGLGWDAQREGIRSQSHWAETGGYAIKEDQSRG